MDKKIIIVSSGQPSANPRLVKEAIALHEAGFKVGVLYCPLSPWADIYDQGLFQNHPEIEWIKVGYHPEKERFLYLYTRIRQKCYVLFYKFFGNQSDAGIRSMVLFSQELVREAKKNQADLYIGHNLGALPAVIKAAVHYAVKSGFDFEDFHRGEDEEGSVAMKKAKSIEEKYVPSLDFFTAASPLIEKAYNKIFPAIPSVSINNCFPASYAVSEVKKLDHQVLKLFWFSQMVGRKRGLEIVLQAMGLLGNGKVSLTLLGNCSAEIKTYLTELAQQLQLQPGQLIFLPAVKEEMITEISSAYHIGLATEVPHIINRELCLTNKLFMYLLAGNALLVSNTTAQKQFINDNPSVGTMFDSDNIQQLATVLENYILHPGLLEAQRVHALILGKEELNWDKEKYVFLKNVERILGK